MRSSLLKTAALAAALVAGHSAQALTFDFTTFAGLAAKATEDYTSEGIVLSATVGSTAFGATGLLLKEGTSPGATSSDPGYYRGLGAVSAQNLDGSLNSGEFVSFALPTNYAVQSITLTRAGPKGQTFTMFLDQSGIGSGIVNSANNVSTDGRTTFRTSRRAGGSIFIVQSDLTNDGGVWINSLELFDLTTVPLPAGFGLLGAALVAGGSLSRRKAYTS